MVAGKKAFDGNSHLEIMNAHLQKTPAPFTNASSEEMDKQLEAAVFKAMDADIDQRYQNVDELYSDLQKLQQNQSIDIKKKPAAQEAKKPSKLLIALCATAAVLAAYYAGSSLNPESENTIIRGGQDGIQYKAHREDVVNGKTIADYNLAIEEKPKDPEVYYDRGWYHQVRDERDSAIEDYSTAIKLDPGFARAYPNRSEMYLMVTKYDKAMADVDKAIKLMPRWYNAYSQRARLEMLMQNYDKAIADANRALELNVICEQALAVLSLVYGELGDHQKALSYITYEGRWQDPNNADDMYWWHFERGMVYLHANDFDHAIEDFKAALAKHHLMSQSWGEMARAYAAKNNMPEALSCIEKAVSLDLFPARALRLKGEMYRAGGKWVEAVQEYSSSTSLEPWYGQGFEQRALAEIALGQMHSAELDLQKAVQLEPFAGTSRAWLALAEDQLGNGEEAKKQLDKGFALLPKKPIMFAIRACISMHTGDFARAIEDCNQAISMDNRLAEGYAYRAIALEAIGKKDEAEKDHATAVKLGWHDYASPLKIGKAQSNEVPKLVQRPLQELDARTEAKVEQQQLTDAQKWAISCGRIWTDRLISNKIRNDDVEALEIMNVAPNNTKWAKQFLERTFNISNRESVLQFISNEGHYGDKYKEIAKKLAGMNEAEVGEFAKQADSYEQGQVGIVLKYKNQPNVDASAFDSVRVITVVRCAFLAGYLNEEESWDYIMQFAKKVQAGNSSWDQFISNYLIGREFFYGGEVPESREVNETIANWRKEPGLGPKRWPFKLDLNKAVKRAPQHT
jgi:tetratricopeptide (TPR) repeat protein